MENNFTTGALLSPIDNRDYDIQKVLPSMGYYETPKEYRTFYNKVLNQGDIGSCVAHTGATIVSKFHHRQTNKWQHFSVGMIYGNRLDGQYQGEGMYPREAWENLRSFGTCYYEDFSINEVYPSARQKFMLNKEILLTKAYPNRISTYCQLKSVDDVKKVLLEGGEVAFTIVTYDVFDKIGRDGMIYPPDKNHKEKGWHEVTVVGWDDEINRYIILNSWGENWGQGGLGYLPYNYPIPEMWGMFDNIYPSKKEMETKLELQINSNIIKIDGIEKRMDTAPFTLNSRTYLPVRFISEALGCYVRFYPSEKKVMVRHHGIEITMFFDDDRIIKNGEIKSMGVNTIIKDGRIFIPVRFLVEALGYKVEWKEETQEVIITNF